MSAERGWSATRGASPAREAAILALRAIEVEGERASVALDVVLRRRKLPAPERALAAELVYGTTRRRLTLDWVLQLYLREDLTALTPWIRNILRLGVYQLLFLTDLPAAIVCDQAAHLAGRFGHRGTVGLVNAVLRRIAQEREKIIWPDPEREPANFLSVVYSHPRWLVERWLVRWGFTEAAALCRANNEVPPLSLRANLLRTNREQLLQDFSARGLTAEPSSWVPAGVRLPAGSYTKGADDLLRQGLCQVQDESSMLIGYLMAPQPGMRILDACCGPGGKATQLAELAGDRVRITAVDNNPRQLALLRENVQRLGITSIEAVEADARSLAAREGFVASFDRVLVDAPCSGLGVIRRRADARWQKRPEDLSTLPALQVEILQAAARCVRSGGVLVYCTCSTEPEENEEVVRRFLAEERGFTLSPVADFLPSTARVQLAALGDEPANGRPFLHLYPHRHGTDGFFIARLVCSSSSEN